MLAPRFTLLDGLRGLAALSVACYHIGATGHPSMRQLAPWPLSSLLLHGFIGVPVFFVVSGFTIAWSLRDVTMNGRVFGRFLLRRSLRLDPPYWVAIALAILSPYQKSPPVPSPGTIAANVFYVADLLRMRELNPVFWTLFLEFQFYLVLAAFLWLMAIGESRPVVRVGVRVALAGLFVLSLLQPALRWPNVEGLFVRTWFAFFAGVCLAWLHAHRLKRAYLLLIAIPVALYVGPCVARSHPGLWSHFTFPLPAFPLGVLAAMLVIFAASQRGTLGTWLGGPTVQYLGRISYSLYLTHGPVGQRIMNLAIGHGGSAVLSVLGAFVGIATSLVAAHLLWRFVEVPSIRWSRSIAL